MAGSKELICVTGCWLQIISRGQRTKCGKKTSFGKKKPYVDLLSHNHPQLLLLLLLCETNNFSITHNDVSEINLNARVLFRDLKMMRLLMKMSMKKENYFDIEERKIHITQNDIHEGGRKRREDKNIAYMPI